METKGDTRGRGIVGFFLTPVGTLMAALSFMSIIQADGWLYGWVQALTVGWRDTLAWFEPYVQQIPYTKIQPGDMENLTIILIVQLAILRAKIHGENHSLFWWQEPTGLIDTYFFTSMVFMTLLILIILFSNAELIVSPFDIINDYRNLFVLSLVVFIGLGVSFRQMIYIFVFVAALHVVSFLQRTIGTINPPWMPG